MATKSTGNKMGSLAGKTLGSANVSQIQKMLAGRPLNQISNHF